MTDSQPGASPSSPRHFYPRQRVHHAMCMALDHGMEFEVMVEGVVRHVKPEHWKCQRLDLCDRFDWYVHPDSLHLLEPQIGDLIHNGCCSYYYTVVEDWNKEWSGNTEVEIERAQEWFSGDHHGKIIQRDGKPFFWPQRETVTASADAAPAA